MLNRIRVLLAEHGAAAAAGRRDVDPLKLAAATLLVEAARMDSRFDAAERGTIAGLLRGHFGLGAPEADELIALAEAEAARSSQIFRFTQTVKDQLSYDERVALIEMLWEVAYADGVLHDYEANLLRRIAGLIHVPDPESGAARKRVLARRAAAGQRTEPEPN